MTTLLLTASIILSLSIVWKLFKDKQNLKEELFEESKQRSIAEEKSSRTQILEEQVGSLQNENTTLKNKCSEVTVRLEEQNKAANEKLEMLSDAKSKLQDAFKALSAEALQKNNQSFLELAKTKLEHFQSNAKSELDKKQNSINDLIKPIRECLSKVDSELQNQEKSRISAYSSLNEQIKALAATQIKSNEAASELTHMLKSPTARGRWGEIQLKNVVEIAGMLPYCDFSEQNSITTEEGRLRPDLTVNLPGKRQVVIDAKVPLSAYLKSLEAKDPEKQKELMQNHVKQVREHMSRLSSKSYWQQFDSSPDFVVMFLPGEAFFSAALEHDTELIERGVDQKIFLASPITLIALLQVIAYGWKQEKMAQSAQEISLKGQELYERLRIFIEHIDKLGKNLSNTVDSYNKASRSLESRVLVSARKFTELGVTSSKDIPELSQIEKEPILIK